MASFLLVVFLVFPVVVPFASEFLFYTRVESLVADIMHILSLRAFVFFFIHVELNYLYIHYSGTSYSISDAIARASIIFVSRAEILKKPLIESPIYVAFRTVHFHKLYVSQIGNVFLAKKYGIKSHYIVEFLRGKAREDS